MEPLLQARELVKHYPGTVALKKISFRLEQNTILGLLGPNSSGKSTFMRIATGQTRPSGGEIRICGRLPGLDTRSLLSYMPDYDHLYAWMSVKETVSFFASFFPSFNREKTAEMLEFMKLPPTKQVGNLSHGMRARLKLVLAFSWDARLVLLGEPLSGIDPASREKIIEGILMGYGGSNKSMIISTHLVSEVETLLNRVIFLREGEIVLDGETDELRDRYGCSLNQMIRRELV
ncbi:MAG: ABC transporter ATP-binding protein [Firmicutes bacterium]|nr:ABC transporter ATP-binding protein [Bacillota bacterium]